MAYVIAGNYSASRAKLLCFSTQQPLIDENWFLCPLQKNSYISYSSSTCQHGQAMLALL